MPKIHAFYALSLLVAAAGVANAEGTDKDATKDPETKRCLSLSQIKSSDVIDSQHIVFTMNDNSLYVTNLPRRCPGLRDDTPWVHSTPISKICDLDTITVLNSFGGTLSPGATCGLGKFEPLAKPDLDALRAELKEQDTSR